MKYLVLNTGITTTLYAAASIPGYDNPYYKELPKTENGWLIPFGDLPFSEDEYIEIQHEGIYMTMDASGHCVSETIEITLANEGTSFTADSYTNTGWTFTATNNVSGFALSYRFGIYQLYTGTSENAVFYAYAVLVRELDYNRERTFAHNVFKYDDGSGRETQSNFGTEIALYPPFSGITSDGWYIIEYPGEQYPYAGKYKWNGETDMIWTSRYASSATEAKVMVRESDGAKIYGTTGYQDLFYMGPYLYRTGSTKTNPCPSAGGQLRYYSISKYKPAFDEIFPGVSYEENTDLVKFNPKFPRLWFEGYVTGITSDGVVLEERTWEECGINEELFGEYYGCLYEGHTSFPEFNVKINGEYCPKCDADVSYSEELDSYSGSISFNSKTSNNSSGYYVTIFNFGDDERAVIFGYAPGWIG